MFLPIIPFFILALFSLLTNTCAVGIVHREACTQGYTSCSPPGAVHSIVPPPGDGLSGLYFDLVSSINVQPVIRALGAHGAAEGIEDTSSAVCCAQGTECRILQSYNLAFCWDRYTTDFFLPDGSYGNIFTGYYSSSSGVIANLVSGDIAFPNGQAGNIYSDTPQAKPVTSILPVPTPWTSGGAGTTIPNSELGAPVSQTATASGTQTSPTNSLFFPSLTSTALTSSQSPVTFNVTGFPTYATATGWGEPYGYGPPPAFNTSVSPSMGGVLPSYRPTGSQLVLCLVTSVTTMAFFFAPVFN